MTNHIFDPKFMTVFGRLMLIYFDPPNHIFIWRNQKLFEFNEFL
jgi:hypothetical protein